jgi:hypothetical protein
MWGLNQLRIYLFFIIIISFVGHLNAQNEISSPYSAFGLGFLSNINSIKNISMGGIGIGTRDNLSINIVNPASYTSFDTTSFLFEGGVAGNYLRLKSDKFDEVATSASISHLVFGFPVTRWWKSSIGLLPFSKVGYKVNSLTFQENIGNVLYTFEGNGGLSRVYWGNAIQPFKFLSLGVNASYLFGSIDRIQNVSFPDSSYYVNTKINNSVSIGDLYFDLGAQYFTQLKKNIKLVVGATYHPKVNLSAKKDYLARTSLGEISGVEFFRDTVDYRNEKGNVILPEGFGLGFSLTKSNYWLFGLDYKNDKWKNFRSFGESDSLVNSQSVALGGQITPDFASNSYIKRIEYRLGGRYYQSYLKLRGKQLDGFGITFGLGLPLRSLAVKGSKSMINISVETGKRGTTDNGLIQETYVNFYFGVSIYESWFFKRRYK